MKGTDDELQFGDQIELDITKDEEDRTVHRHMDCKFIPELVELLLENDIIEQRDCKGPEGLSEEEVINDIYSRLEELNDRLTAIEEKLANKRHVKVTGK